MYVNQLASLCNSGLATCVDGCPLCALCWPFQVRVTANRGGSASLRLLYDKPGGARLGDPGVVPSLAVTLPLQLASGALVAGGCALRAAAGADGVTVSRRGIRVWMEGAAVEAPALDCAISRSLHGNSMRVSPFLHIWRIKRHLHVMQVRKLSAEEEHCLAAQHQGLVATGQPHNCWLVNCGELTSLRLEVDMQVRGGREA